MKRRTAIIASIILIYLLLDVFVIGCPIKLLTGLSCPGCGMTRAYLSLLNLDIKKAFAYHPLFPLPIILLLMWMLGFRGKRISNAFVFFICLLFIGVYVYRIIDHDPIVNFNIQEGLIFQLINS